MIGFCSMLGRMFFSLIFILSSILKILDWQSVEQSVLGAISVWQTHTSQVEWVQRGLDQLSLWPFALVVLAVIFELGGGLLVFLGIKVRLGATLLFLFLIPTTLLFHNFWFLQGSDRDLQTIMFLKNLSIAGGALLLMAFGKGGSKAPSGEKKTA